MAYTNDTEETEEVAPKEDFDKTEVSAFLKDTLSHYRDLQSLQNPYYGFTSLRDKWNEYERCYNVQAKTEDEKTKRDYKGFTDVVLPDFHEKIEIIRTREVNSLFSGADQFTTTPQRNTSEENARLAKLIVKYNFNCVNLRTETSCLSLDRLMYGTFQAYTPFCTEEIVTEETITYRTDPETGKALLVDGVTQITLPYKAKVTRTLKYTKLERLFIGDVYINPEIDSVQDQPAVFIRMKKSYAQLLKMEQDGQLFAGEADVIKELYNRPSVVDSSSSKRDSKMTTETDPPNKEITIFEVFLCYFWKEDKNDEMCLYESIFVDNSHIAGYTKVETKKIPLIKGVYIKGRGYYGLGMGDEMYPVYMAKNTRMNQVIDKSSFEILGAGGYDPQYLPANFTRFKPGEYFAMPGLAGIRQAGGDPILSVNKIMGDARASMGIELLNYMTEAIQTGTGANQLLAGQPTNSQIDKTVGGIKAVISQSNERINAYLKDFEDQLLKEFAVLCYENYQHYLDPMKDIEKMLDLEDLTYTNDAGEEQVMTLVSGLNKVDFVFTATKQIVESEEEIGKFERFLRIMGELVRTVPIIGEQLIKETDFKYVIKKLGFDLEIGDLDKLFPKVNYVQIITELQKQLADTQTQLQMQSMAVRAVKQKLAQDQQTSALDSINEVEGAIKSSQQGGDMNG